MGKGPNVLMFVPHDLGDHLGCYGHRTVRSPRLDGLAAEGVRFTSYFTATPECTSSRASMMTGVYPHQNGLMGLANFGWALHPNVPHLARRLREHGYDTRLFGVQHETDQPPEQLGYAHVHARKDRGAPAVCAELAEFLAREARQSGPWFACAGFTDVHRVWPAETVFKPDEIGVPGYLPDLPAIRADLARFHQAILTMDGAVGRALDALDAAGLAEDTIVIFTTDHGCGCPRAKATLYDPGIRIPLIARQRGRIEGGRTLDCLAGNVDFTPTVLDCCGLPAAEGIEGRSLLPMIEGRDPGGREAVFGELLYDVSYDPMHYARTRTHKYIRSFGVTPEERAGADPAVLTNFAAGQWIRVDDFDVMSGATWMAMDVDAPPPAPEELYDLAADPLEQRNLASEPGAARVLEAMRARLHGWMERTDSPLLHGHVPPPPKQVEASHKYRPGGPMYDGRPR